MKELFSFPICAQSLSEYASPEELQASCSRLGCSGVEAVWGGGEAVGQLPEGLVCGYHLLFYADWLDFWRGDRQALSRKFGSRAAWAAFYGGEDRGCLLEQYRRDLQRAARLGASYVVFHVSDVSIEEGYTYRWLHSDDEVIDGALELINTLTAGQDWPFAILVENQWWPGFTFTDPQKTARLLEGIRAPNKGLLLDTGHLMNANLCLESQQEGAAFLHRMLDLHGKLSGAIRAVHLHQSLSGSYVRAHTGALPPLPAEYLERFAAAYSHILQIDRHQPWTVPEIRDVIERISPEFLTHELSAAGRRQREEAILRQRTALHPPRRTPRPVR